MPISMEIFNIGEKIFTGFYHQTEDYRQLMSSGRISLSQGYAHILIGCLMQNGQNRNHIYSNNKMDPGSWITHTHIYIDMHVTVITKRAHQLESKAWERLEGEK